MTDERLLTINEDIAGWWVVNHPYPADKHALADPCPLDDPQCRLDRTVLLRRSSADESA